jgi:hypothetical protein
MPAESSARLSPDIIGSIVMFEYPAMAGLPDNAEREAKDAKLNIEGRFARREAKNKVCTVCDLEFSALCSPRLAFLSKTRSLKQARRGCLPESQWNPKEGFEMLVEFRSVSGLSFRVHTIIPFVAFPGPPPSHPMRFRGAWLSSCNGRLLFFSVGRGR